MITLEQIATLTGAVSSHSGGDELAAQSSAITGVAAPDSAGPADLVFAQTAGALAMARASRAGAILAASNLKAQEPSADPDGRLIWVEDARLAFARVAKALRPVLAGTQIDPSAVIAADARIGRGVRIGAGAVIETGVEIGDHCELEARVVVYGGTTLGRHVVVKAGAVLGSAGFGFARDAGTGEYLPFPQQGRLILEDDVSVGANATIDRGALGETRIGRGTKIDNLVHVAHNCTIGRDVVIAAQTGIAGSSVVEDGAVLGGQVGVADHVTIGAGVIVGAKAGVPSNKSLHGAGEVFWGIPARPIAQYLREQAWLKRAAKKSE